MDQMSLLSATSAPPVVADLAGVLCGPGQAVTFGRGTAARFSVVLDDPGRARALRSACADRGVEAGLSLSEEGRPALRTAFRSDLTRLAAAWSRGAVKAVPDRFTLDGPTLRIWALTSGRPGPTGYELGLDAHAPDTHEPLLTALTRIGLPAKPVGTGREPAIRITGKRRLSTLAELVGPLPSGLHALCWPVV